MSTGTTAAVTSPEPDPVNAPVGYVAVTGVSCCSVDGGTKTNGKLVERDVVAGGRHPLDHVVDAVLVAGRAGRARPAVGVSDRLERRLVFADTLQR